MNRSVVTRAVGGLIIFGLGLFFLLHNTGVIDAGTFTADWWPLIIIAAGVLLLVGSLHSLAGWFLVALGGAYQLKELDVVDFEPWAVVWPLIIIFVGISILFRQSYKGEHVNKGERDDLTAILGGTSSINTSKKFKEARVTAILGGGVLDLRKANIADGALVEVFGFWGGVEIVVPKDVIVKKQINNILAGTEDKTDQEINKDSPTLTIAGDLIMAGASIRNTPSNNS